MIALQLFVTYCQPRPQINYTSNDHTEYTEIFQEPVSYFIYLFIYLQFTGRLSKWSKYVGNCE